MARRSGATASGVAAGEDSQVDLVGAGGPIPAPRQGGVDLLDIVEVVHRPGGQQLAERHLPDFWVPPAPVEVGLVRDQLPDPGQVVAAKLWEALDQGGQGNALVALDVGEAVR